VPPSSRNEVPAIVVEGLTKQFGDKVAVEDLSFQVQPGTFFGFLGPNGAGKSTTMQMLAGLMRPTRGSIRIAGLDVAREPLTVKGLLGIVPEELPLYDRLTGEEYLDLAARLYGLSRSAGRQRAEELLQFLDLAQSRATLVADYSMGMKKKLALAAALIHDPQLLLLDEPLNGVDPISARVVSDLLRKLAARGTTVFFTSHVLDVVERLCDEVGIIHQGRLVAQGTIAAIRASQDDARLEDAFLALVSADVSRGDLSWVT
jgi:ABC-2 type transport system ATP-binding protein